MLVLIILLFGSTVLTQECTKSFLCDDGVCKSGCGPTDCAIPDGKECDGILLPMYNSFGDMCSCCNNECITYLKENAVCQSTLSNPTKMCGPRLKCGNRRCVPMTTNCMNEIARMHTEGQGMNEAPPQCDDHGFYEPVQCYPGGLCRCVDEENGEPIALGFGISGGIEDSETSQMNCRCARQYHNALKAGCRMAIHYSDYVHLDGPENHYLKALDSCYESAFSSSAMMVSPEDNRNVYFGHGQMRCLPNGNFDPLQCVDRYLTNGMCFCMHENVEGIVVNGTQAPKEETEELQCYDKTIHFYNYYRPCEAKIAEVKREKLKFENEGRMYIYTEFMPTCTPDGYYAKLQNKLDQYNALFCSNKDGNQIDNYVGDRSTLSGRKMNCECALTREVLSEGSVKPTCCKNGNFKGQQCYSGLCYCVDKYGRQLGLEVDQVESHKLNCEDYCCENPPYNDVNEFCFEETSQIIL